MLEKEVRESVPEIGTWLQRHCHCAVGCGRQIWLQMPCIKRTTNRDSTLRQTPQKVGRLQIVRVQARMQALITAEERACILFTRLGLR